MPFEEENKSKAYKDSEIIVDNDKLVFVKSNSIDSVKYFGPNFVSRNYLKNYANGDLYFIFDKRDPHPQSEPHTYTIFKDRNNKLTIFNHAGGELSLKQLVDEFPSLKDEINELIGVSDIYNALVSIKNGNEMTRYEIGKLDELVDDLKFKPNSPGNSMVKLKFEHDDEYLQMFDLSDDDIWFIRAVNSRYESFEFEHWDTISYDWDEGYLIRNFNDENIDRVNDILKYLNPKLVDFREDDDKLASEVCNLLRTKFERQIDYIIGEYVDLTNECKTRAAQEDIDSSLCNKLIDYGIYEKYCFNTYYTSVNVLLALYKKSGNKSLSIKELISHFTKEIPMSSFYDGYYEYYCNDFDDAKFQEVVKDKLEDIKDNVIDNPDYFLDIEEYQKIYDFIFPRFKLNTVYKLDRDKNISFSIEDISHENNKIIVVVRKGSNIEKRSYDLEGFKAFLSTGELFN